VVLGSKEKGLGLPTGSLHSQFGTAFQARVGRPQLHSVGASALGASNHKMLSQKIQLKLDRAKQTAGGGIPKTLHI
jgi:hypothetical protein